MRQINHTEYTHYGTSTFSLKLPRSAVPISITTYDDNPNPIMLAGQTISKPIPTTKVVIVYSYTHDSDYVDRMFRVSLSNTHLTETEVYLGSYEHNAMIYHVIAQFITEDL